MPARDPNQLAPRPLDAPRPAATPDEWTCVMDVASRRRTIRRFRQERPDRRRIEQLLDVARLAPSAANLQPLRFLVVDDPAQVAAVTEAARWAMYLDDGAPKPAERPTVFVLVFRDSTCRKTGYEQLDVGLAAATIILGAESMGLGSCILAALARARIQALVGTPETLELVIAIALGYPAEQPVAVPVTGGCLKYHRAPDGTLQVPKRSLEEVLVRPPAR